MNTLYEVLEVSENASIEVIEKAYKVLAKKYHPDLQGPENRQSAEKKMKEINEAYEVLSDETKRRQYDEKLSAQREQEKQQRIIEREQENRQRNLEREQENRQRNVENQNVQNYEQDLYRRDQDMQRRRYEEDLRRQQEKMRKQMQENMEKEYQNAYYNYLRSLGYRIKESWTWEKTKSLLLTILIMVGIIGILWIFPPTHNMMMNFYESNPLIKAIIDIIINTVVVIFKTIGSFFENIFAKK